MASILWCRTMASILIIGVTFVALRREEPGPTPAACFGVRESNHCAGDFPAKLSAFSSCFLIIDLLAALSHAQALCGAC